MKPFLTVVALLAFCGAAQASPAPTEPMRLTHAPEEMAMSVGPAGAMRESNYFRAPQRPVTTGHVFPCRLQMQVFDKTHLAQSCH
jgi:hypothetical protein